MFFSRLFRSRRAPRPTARSRVRRLAVETLDERIAPVSLTIGDVSLFEGNSGVQYALVSVNLNAPAKKTVSVNYSTTDGSAKAGSDYGAKSGKLTFAPGETSRTISVPVYGDRLLEANESFSVKLSGAKNAWISDSVGIVHIVDDEPQISISDASGTRIAHDGMYTGTTLTFYVTLPAAFDQPVTVNYATADGTAVECVDYVGASGTLTFAPGETIKTINIEVLGNDSGVTEWFAVNLSGASSNAPIADGQGIGTINYYFVQPPYDPGSCDPDGPYYPNC
jgi:hypothetical protein